MTIICSKHEWSVDAPLNDGNGGFGKVYRVYNEQEEPAAAKFVPKEAGADRELLIGDDLRSNDYQNVVPVIDEGETDEYWILVMPLAKESLARYLHDTEGPLDLAQTVSILKDIATALESIQGKIVHRDLKPDNVLFLDGKWRIADFGISRYADASTSAETRKYSFTPPYAAPEQWNNEHATSATDIYSLGVIGYRLLSGELPFKGPEVADYRHQHLYDNPPELTTGTARLKHIIEECLYKAPKARPSATNVLERLSKASTDPNMPALSHLIAANQKIVKQRSETFRAQSEQQQIMKYRSEMYLASKQSFQSLLKPLKIAIKENASTAEITGTSQNSIKTRYTGTFETTALQVKFGNALLRISSPQPEPGWEGHFDVVASADITLTMSRNTSYWNGRSHSLWFCDATEKDKFGWFELAFMENPLIRVRSKTIEPFSCHPKQASTAFENGIGTMQLAWPVDQIDLDDPEDFVNRWLNWFAEAADGNLRYPSTMPEKSISHSWRN